MSAALIRTERLKVGYNGRCVVDGVDINAMRGTMTCLLGPNGAGKSTILRTLSGMLAPVEGTVYLEDMPVSGAAKSTLAKRLAVVLTDKFSPGLMTAFEIAAMGRHPYTGFFGKLKDRDREIVYDALRAVNAEKLSERYYNELSDGEKQKVMIARALAQQPELIVLDEPTSHLDIRHRVEVVSILGNLCRTQGITVILSLHDIDLALKGCEIVLMVKDGHIVRQGSPEEIVRAGTVQELYGISGACYDDLLGSLELGGAGESRIFVTGGAGSAVPVYRALRRIGVGMDSGVLHDGDVDAHVASAICNRVILAPAFEPITEEQRNRALALARECGRIVDAGFPVGDANRENISLLRAAAEEGIEILSLRPEGSMPYGGGRVSCFANAHELALHIVAALGRKDA